MRHRIVTVTLNPAIDRTYTLEGFSTEKLNIAQSVRMDAGGKGINVARALRKLGADVAATGLNGGFTGGYLESLLRSEGIPYDFYEVGGDTRVNIKIADTRTGMTTELNEKGFHVNEGILSGFLQKLRDLAEEAEYLILCGRLPQGANPGLYGEIIREYKNKGVKVILDADNEALKMGVAEAPFAVKPNLKELAALTGRLANSDEEIISESRALIRSGIAYVAVTMGENGLLLMSGGEAYKAKPFPIRASSTTGAGDAALAALIYCLTNNMTLSESAAYMACAGTLSASLQGTSACGIDEIRKSVSKIALERIP